MKLYSQLVTIAALSFATAAFANPRADYWKQPKAIEGVRMCARIELTMMAAQGVWITGMMVPYITAVCEEQTSFQWNCRLGENSEEFCRGAMDVYSSMEINERIKIQIASPKAAGMPN